MRATLARDGRRYPDFNSVRRTLDAKKNNEYAPKRLDY